MCQPRIVRSWDLRCERKLRDLMAGRGSLPATSGFKRWLRQHFQESRATETPRTVFAYSYAARDIFLFARARGWRTVLGQIDGGPLEERTVSRLMPKIRLCAGGGTGLQRSIGRIGEKNVRLLTGSWLTLCGRRARLKGKACQRPRSASFRCAYEGSAEAAGFQREYPKAFTSPDHCACYFLAASAWARGYDRYSMQ